MIPGNKQCSAGLLIVLLSALLFTQCATPGFPTGGERDKTPPVIKSQSPPNETVNFNDNKLVIEFDEFIQIQNPGQNLLISPPPLNFPDVDVKRNTLEIHFKDGLEPNTTYALQFGDNIRDNNEGNALPNFKWVFSTGNYLDSIKIDGTLMVSTGSEMPENTWVVLYSNLEDSAFISQRPYYFTKVERSTGLFSLDHLKEGIYKIYALEDKNMNYYFDLPTEKVAFLDSAIVLNESQTISGLKLFDPEPDKQYLVDYSTSLKEHSWYLKLAKPLNTSETWKIQPLSDSIYHRSSLSPDRQTITTWVQQPYQEASIPWEITLSEQVFDTLFINHKGLEPAKQNQVSQQFGRPAGTTQQALPSSSLSSARGFWAAEGDTILLPFTSPLMSVNKDSMLLVKDASTVFALDYAELSADSMSAKLFSPVASGNYNLKFTPGGITFFTTGANKDTLGYNIAIADTNLLGALIINISLPADYQSIITVRSSQQTIHHAVVKTGEGAYKVHLPRQQAGVYTVEVIEDRDANGLYSSGSFTAKRQPERIFISSPIELKAGWEQETSITVKFGE